MIIYIAGPITGVFDYRQNFTAAERELTAKGHTVINPSMLPSGLGEIQNYMPIRFAMIDQCDAIYFLNGYQSSEGSMLERRYGFENRKKLFYEGESD